MLKILFNLFPYFDHLYIFQILEYSLPGFLSWFIRNPFSRRLQRKHSLVWTPKSSLIFAISILWLLLDSVFIVYFLDEYILFPIILILLSQIYPKYLIISQIILWPFEAYQKYKLIDLAKKKVGKFKNLRAIAITGSFGKTSTKDILYTLLWKKYRVVKTPKSFNTPLGVAETILEYIKDNTEVLIVEAGAYKKGEIKKIADLVHPDISVITAIGPQHLERFGSLENIAITKFELIEGMKEDGLGILNGNFPKLTELSQNSGKEIVFYGSKDSKYRVENIRVSLMGTAFDLITPKSKLKIRIPLIGEHHAYNFLAAAIAALNLGLTEKELVERAGKLIPTPHRMEVSRKDGYVVIDNSFNANLESSKSSFKLLGDLEASHKIVVTPGLIELGEDAKDINKEFIKLAARVVDEIIIVGENAKKYLLEGLKEAKFDNKHIHLAQSTSIGILLAQRIARKGSLILIENDLPDQYT